MFIRNTTISLDREQKSKFDFDKTFNGYKKKKASCRYFYASSLPVQVYAELRAGLKPPRLLKLHGDFSDVGRREFVAGHSDYRQLMVRDIAFSK